jgi:hypothetical protein
MPAGWVHATLDLITFGEPHLDVHQWKDAPWRRLGTAHRRERHDWYQAGLTGVWTMDDPFPAWEGAAVDAIGADHGDVAAERYMVDITHDFWDRWWDATPRNDRKCIETAFAWLLFQPDILRDRYGVDVRRGYVLREIDGKLLWRHQPAIVAKYHALTRYVRRVVAGDATMTRLVFDGVCTREYSSVDR